MHIQIRQHCLDISNLSEHNRISLLLTAEKLWKLNGEKTLRLKLRSKLGLKDLQGRLNKFEIVFFLITIGMEYNKSAGESFGA
jgi:hypothetical protein